MSARRLMLIDSDDDFHRLLYEQLTPYGFEIYKIDETADALGQVSQIAPEIIFIAVEEPDKLGYSLCNKAKKGVAQNLPVILTTATVPPAGFNSHRRLRVHADEYVDKRTMSTEELMQKIGALVTLGEAQSEAFDFPLEVVDEVDIADAEEVLVDDVATGGFDGDEERTRIAPPEMLMDNDLLDEPEASFVIDDDPALDDPILAEIEEDMEEATSTSRPHLRDPQAAGGAPAGGAVPAPVDAADDDQPIVSSPHPSHAARGSRSGAASAPHAQPSAADEEPELVGELEPVFELDAPEATFEASGEASGEASLEASGPAAAAPGVGEAQAERIRALEEEKARLAAELEQARAAAGERDREAERARALEESARSLEERARSLEERARSLEEEKTRLTAELAQAREAAAQGGATPGGDGSFSRERELLGLRETINKKEREILDLRDETGTKDREILDLKEQLRRLEHNKTSLDAKNLELEQRILEQNESIAAREREKQELSNQLAEREARLSELTAKAQADSEQAQADLAAQKAESAAAIERLESEHAAALAQAAGEAKAEQERALDALGRQHEEAKAAQEQAHAAALAQAEAQAEERRRSDVEAAERQAAEARASLEAAHKEEIAGIETRHAEERSRLQSQHEQEKQAQAEEHARKQAQLEQEGQDALAVAQDQAQADLDAARATHTQAMEQAAQERAAEKQALESAHAEAEAAHRQKREELEAELRSAQQTIAAMSQKQTEAERTLAEQQKTIEGHLDTIAQREDRVATLAQELEELEGQNAGYQEQVLKAYRKIKTDEASIERAKKALAIALTVLDETAGALPGQDAPGSEQAPGDG